MKRAERKTKPRAKHAARMRSRMLPSCDLSVAKTKLLRQRRCAPSPACGGGPGWGCPTGNGCCLAGSFPHPPRSGERVDLPRKRERWQRARLQDRSRQRAILTAPSHWKTKTNSPSAVIAREGGRSSIPETLKTETRGRGVLDPPHARGTTTVGGDASSQLPRIGKRKRTHPQLSSPAKAGDPVFQRR